MSTISKTCLLCGFSTITASGIEFNFLPSPETQDGRSIICRYCEKRTSTCQTWVYIDDKFRGLLWPEKYHIPIELEAHIRNLLSQSDNVYLCDGERLWRWMQHTPVLWPQFNRLFDGWKKLLWPLPEVIKPTQATLEMVAKSFEDDPNEVFDAYKDGHLGYML